jgi:uncharacterized protein (DUF885 family)
MHHHNQSPLRSLIRTLTVAAAASLAVSCTAVAPTPPASMSAGSTSTAAPSTSAAAQGTSTAAPGTSAAAPGTSAAAPGTSIAAASSSFATASDSFAAEWVRLSPERATFNQYFSGAEQDALDAELTPLSDAQRERERTLARSGLAQVERWLAGPLTPAERVDALTLQWSLQRTLAAAPFQDHVFLFSQTSGLQVRSVGLLTQTHPLRRPADVASYLLRLAQLPARFDEAIARTRQSAARGILPPRFILERSRGQIEAFLQPAPADNLLVTALAERSQGMPGLAPEARTQALQRAQALVADGVRPAFQRALDLLNDLHPRTTPDAGVWRLPDGAAAYAQALASNTTTPLTADAIHALGLREVARIEAEMDRVFKSLGRNSGSVPERMAALRAELQPPAEPDPRPAILARFTEMVRDNQRRSQALFSLQPKAPVDVRRVPALTERTASAYYTTPTPDGSRPGIFWAPLPGPVFNIPGMRSLAVHEAIPGHHFQLALQQEQASLPRWRQQGVFGGGSAHSEGWGLYAERLAIDNGWYDGDAASLLGALDSQLFRARRLVVDTGLHAKRWTREQAISYGIGAQEVERYVVNPGQACAYMVGMLHILALRDEAQAALGAKFRIQDFHDVVLRTGSVPLDVLSSVVRQWVASAVAAAPARRQP